MIASRLKVISQYAVDNWETVQDEWLKLFRSTGADTDVTKKLETFEEEMTLEKKTSISNSSSGKVVIDEARFLLAEGQNSLNHFHMLRQALDSITTADGGVFGVLVDTNPKISDPTSPVSSNSSSGLIGGKKLASFPPFVLTHTMDVFWQKHCDEQAVRSKKMRDNDETVVDMKDEAVAAESKEMKRDDVADNKSTASDGKKAISANEIAYKDAVTGSDRDAWNALVRMGRPMWYGKFANLNQWKFDVLQLGLSPGTGSYREENIFGIASLLCRVGLRPYSTSPVAPRAVADLMAILADVNNEKEGYVCSYASDPVLTLGAIAVWYSLDVAVAKFILPQLKELILNEALDTGEIGGVVARIVLLFAMDKCAIEVQKYAGEFITVHAFLKAFGVEEMSIFMSPTCAETGDTEEAFCTWISKWDGWRMGFTHFVQLKMEPTEETLWYLLGRRAADIFPRNQKGADLLIPIFWKKTDGEASSESEMQTEVDAKVSLILIQVKNRSGFPMSATTKLCPSFVFGNNLKKPKVPANNLPIETPAKSLNEESGEGLPMEDVENPSIRKPVEDPPIKKLVENPLSKKSVRDVICIYINVQEEDTKHHQFIYASTIDDGNKSNDGNGAKLADTPGKNESNSMEAASSSTSGENRTRTNVSESKTHGSEPKVSDCLKAESTATASGSNDSKTKVASELRFTFCYRSVRCDTYKFLDVDVVEILAGLVETLWDPWVLVGGDLEVSPRGGETF